MDEFLKAIGKVTLALLIVVVGAIIGGTIIWVIWPFCIPFVFPKLVHDGILCADIGWVPAVLLTWVLNILLNKTTVSTE